MLARIHEEMLDGIKHLDADVQGRVLLAYVNYQLYGTEPSQDDILVYSIFKAKQFDLDSIIGDMNASRENWKKGWRPKKSYENLKKPNGILKQPKHNLRETEQEQEQEIIEKEDNKLSSKKKKDSSLTPLELIDAYKADSILSGKIKDADAVKQRVEYKQRKKERAYKTTSGFIQQLAVMVKTVENWMPRTDVWGRLQFAVNQAEENERKWIVWNDKIEQDYLSFKKFNSLWMNKQHNE